MCSHSEGNVNLLKNGSIAFVSFHISCIITSHFTLSFRSSTNRTDNVHSLRLHPYIFGVFPGKNVFFLICSARSTEIFSPESTRPLFREPTVQSAHATFYPMRRILLATPAVRTTREGAAKRTAKNPLPRRGWERRTQRKYFAVLLSSIRFIPFFVCSYERCIYHQKKTASRKYSILLKIIIDEKLLLTLSRVYQ